MDKFVTRGNGKAIHVAKEYAREDGTIWLVAAKCDGWGASAGRIVRYVQASEATCQRCK